MQDQGSGDKGSTNLLWAVFGIFAVLALVWYFFGDILKIWFINIRLFQLQIIGVFTSKLDPLAAQLQELDPQLIDWALASYISNLVGKYMSIPLALIIGGLIMLIYFRNVGMRYTKTYDMELLLGQEKGNWPQTTPVSKLDLVNQDIDKGPWAMAKTPLQVCKKHNMMEVDLVPDSSSQWKREPVAKATLKKDLARRVLARQLGPHWEGIDKLPMHAKAIFALCAARIDQNKDGALALIRDIAMSSANGKPSFAGTDALLRKHRNHKDVQKVIQHHAYVCTVMASMMATARNDGVFAMADLLWLKPMDRRLWYTLHSIGRQVAFSEAGGPFSHWKVELEMGRPLSAPFIEEAVKAFEMALNETIYVPDDDELEALMAKRGKRR